MMAINWNEQMGDGREEEVGNQYVKEGGQGVAARNSPLLGAGKKKQDFSPPLQPISLKMTVLGTIVRSEVCNAGRFCLES